MWERVEQLLCEKDLSVADLSRLTGIGKSTFSGCKNGKYQPKSDKRQKVADALGVSLLYLDGYTDERSSTTSTVEPVYDVAGGKGRLNDDYATDFQNLNENEQASDGFSWCRVCGDSMYPVLQDGDYIKVEHMTQTNPSDLTVIKINGDEATVKYVEVMADGIMLRAKNKDVFEDTHYSVADVLTMPITIVGKVVEMKRKF